MNKNKLLSLIRTWIVWPSIIAILLFVAVNIDSGYAFFNDFEHTQANISAGIWDVAQTEGTKLDARNTANGFFEDGHYGVRGTMCIVNMGEEATENLRIDMQVQYQQEGESDFHNVADAIETIEPQTQLEACDSPNQADSCPKECYPFEISFEPVKGAVAYRHFEQVTITNHKEWQPGSGNCPGTGPCPHGPIIKTLFELPPPPTKLEAQQSAEVVIRDDIGLHGEVCVTNAGEYPTQGLAIANTLLAKNGQGATFKELASLWVNTDEKPELNAGEKHCYPYQYALDNLSFKTKTLQTVADVTIENHEGWLPGSDPCEGAEYCPFGPQIKTNLDMPILATTLNAEQNSEIVLREDNQDKPYQLQTEICVHNTGTFPTRSLVIRNIFQLKNKGVYSDYVTRRIDTGEKPVLKPGESHCYPYELAFPDPPDAIEGRNIAEVMIINYKGWLPGSHNCPGTSPCPGGPSLMVDFILPTPEPDPPTPEPTPKPSETPEPSTQLEAEQTIEAFTQGEGDSTIHGIQAEICVTNTGEAVTTGLSIEAITQIQTEEEGEFTELASKRLDLGENAVLKAGESQCYTYEQLLEQLPDAFVGLRNVADVTITNYEGWLPGDEHCQGIDVCPHGPVVTTAFTLREEPAPTPTPEPTSTATETETQTPTETSTESPAPTEESTPTPEPSSDE